MCSRVGETERLVCTRSCNALAVEVPHPLQGVYRQPSGRLSFDAERYSRSGPQRAEAGTRAAAPFPAPLSPLAASFLRCTADRFLLTKPNTSCTIEMPASLRSDGVRVHPGMPFGFPSESAFGFAGILSDWRDPCSFEIGVSYKEYTFFRNRSSNFFKTRSRQERPKPSISIMPFQRGAWWTQRRVQSLDRSFLGGSS